MKQWFLFGLILIIPVAVLSALLYSVGKYVVSLVGDWRLYRELDALEAEGEARRRQREQEALQRLDNGCEHKFDAAIGFPPDVCPRCGLAQRRPNGSCDHVWRRSDGPVPGSYCTKCGKQFRPAL